MTTGEKIINKAESYKGKTGSFVWNYWSGLSWGSSWCVGFVLYVLYKCGLKKEIYNPSKTSLPFWLPTIEEWLHKHATHVKMADAQPGDIVIFTWDGGGNNSRLIGKKSRDHIGFIRKKGTSKKAYTIEGNTSGGKVAERTRELTYIFAIYRLDCCKTGSQETPAEETKEKTGDKTLCLDISAWQGEISVANWKKIKKEIPNVILRSSYTNQNSFTLNKDKYFDANIKNAHEAGMNIGIYHYSQAVTEAEAKKEAEYCSDCILPYKKYISLPVAFDWEFGGRLNSKKAKANGKKKNGAICSAFCEIVKSYGFDVMVYANLSTLNNYLPADLSEKWKIWIAQYNKTCDYKHPWFMWQYTSSGKVTGISGKVDVNRFASESEQKQPEKESAGIVLPDRGWFQKGDTGEDVKQLQELLNKKNKGSILPDLEPDGEFGEKTEEHVELFQDARHLTVDGQIGNKTLPKLQKATTGIIDKGINFLVSVARDNSFAYGTGKRAHHNGCYFCGTNITGPKKAKKGSRWEKTYCCNPFIHAGWAHGGGHKDMLKDCKKANAAGMEVKDWTKYGFEDIGKVKDVPFSSLKRGDVIITHNHVFEYTGGNWIVEASGGTWKASSIAHKKIAKKKYAAYKNDSKAHVMRYKG